MSRFAVYWADDKWWVAENGAPTKSAKTKKKAKKKAQGLAQQRATLNGRAYGIDIYTKNDDLTQTQTVEPLRGR